MYNKVHVNSAPNINQLEVFRGDRNSKPLFGQFQVQLQSAKCIRIAVIGLTLLQAEINPLMPAMASFFRKKGDWRLVFMSEAYAEAFELVSRLECDGVIARVVSMDIAKVARSLTCPVVNISSLLEDSGVPTVRRNERGMGAMTAKHLLIKGFTRFGVIDGPYHDWCFSQSKAGFIDEVESTLENPVILRHCLTKFDFDNEDITALKSWLMSIERPFALYLCDDTPANKVMDVCLQVGLRIPQDVAVIAGRAHPEFIHHCVPSLTRPKEDGEWLMLPACEYLERLIRDPNTPRRIIEVQNPGLVLGDSTNTIAADDPLVAVALDYINDHYLQGVNVADVVTKVGCSRRTLELRFMALIKVTIHDYLTAKRVKAAEKRLLSSLKESKGTLASACGFSTWKNLVSAFKAAHGHAPPEWVALKRARHHQEAVHSIEAGS